MRAVRLLPIAVTVVVTAAGIAAFVAWWQRERPSLEPVVRQAPVYDAAPDEVATPASSEAARTATRVTTQRYGRVMDAATGIALAEAPIGWPASANGGMLRRDVWSLQRMRVEGRSDDDGRFALAAAEDDWLVIAAEGYAPRAVASQELGRTDVEPLVIQLTRPARLRATVLEADGRPASGVTVRLLERIGAVRFVVEATTDARGEALIADVPTDRELEVELTEGLALLDCDVVTMRFTAGEGIVKRWKLRGGPLVSGRVVDSNGVPVPDTAVDWHRCVPLELGAAAADRAAREAEPIYGAMRWSGARIVTDGDGRFVWPDVASGFAIFAADAEERGAAAGACHGPASGWVEVREGARSAWLELVVERGLEIVGRLVGPDDAPVVGTVGTRFIEKDGTVEWMASVATDKEGRFRFRGATNRTVLTLAGTSLDESLATREPVKARVSSGEVVVRVELQQRVVVQAHDEAGAERAVREVRFFRPDGSQVPQLDRAERFEQRENGLELQRVGFEPGTYDVLVFAGESEVALVRGFVVQARGTSTIAARVGKAAILEVDPSPVADAVLDGEENPGVSHAVGVRVLAEGVCLAKCGSAYADPKKNVIRSEVELFVPAGAVTLEWIDNDGRKRTQQLTLVAGERRRVVPPREE